MFSLLFRTRLKKDYTEKMHLYTIIFLLLSSIKIVSAGSSVALQDLTSSRFNQDSFSKKPLSKIIQALHKLEDRKRPVSDKEFEIMLEYGGYDTEVFADNGVNTHSILTALQHSEEDDGWSQLFGAFGQSGILESVLEGVGNKIYGEKNQHHDLEIRKATGSKKKRRRSLKELQSLTPEEERELELHLKAEDEDNSLKNSNPLHGIAENVPHMSNFEDRLRRLKERVKNAKLTRINDLKEHMKDYLWSKRMKEVEKEERNDKLRKKFNNKNPSNIGNSDVNNGESVLPNTRRSLSKSELTKERLRHLEEKSKRQDRRLEEVWNRRLQIKKDEYHPIWDDPFAFLGQHAVNSFFEIDTDNDRMRRYELSDEKIKELQAKRSLSLLEESTYIEDNKMSQLHQFYEKGEIEEEKFLELKDIQLRRLALSEQAYEYNRRLLGEDKFLTEEGIERRLKQDPWLRRERKLLEKGRRRVLKELVLERTRLESFKSRNPNNMEKMWNNHKRRLNKIEEYEEKKLQNGFHKRLRRNLLQKNKIGTINDIDKNFQADEENSSSDFDFYYPLTSNWILSPSISEKERKLLIEEENNFNKLQQNSKLSNNLNDEKLFDPYYNLDNEDKEDEDLKLLLEQEDLRSLLDEENETRLRLLSNHTASGGSSSSSGNGTAATTVIVTTTLPAVTMAPIKHQAGVSGITLTPSGLAYPAAGRMAGWSFMGPWGTDYIPYGDFLGAGDKYVIHAAKPGDDTYGQREKVIYF